MAKKTEIFCDKCIGRRNNKISSLCEMHEQFLSSDKLLDRTLKYCENAFRITQEINFAPVTGRSILNAWNNYLYWLGELKQTNEDTTVLKKLPIDPFADTIALELRNTLFKHVGSREALMYDKVTPTDLIYWEDTYWKTGTIFLEGKEKEAAAEKYRRFKQKYGSDRHIQFYERQEIKS